MTTPTTPVVDAPPIRTPLAKMQYLIKRRAGVSRDELIVNWFANHMPDVIASQRAQAERGRLHAERYIATLFQPGSDGTQAWDGVAQLWWARPLPQPDEPHGAEPRDTFQQKAEPYRPWATAEYVVIDGELPVTPNTLDPPYPCTRTGFCKYTSLIAAEPGTDYEAFFAHWLGPHAANAGATMAEVGAIRYAISLADAPEAGPYAGMAEGWFPDLAALDRFRQRYVPDGIEQWIDRDASCDFLSTTELIGIP